MKRWFTFAAGIVAGTLLWTTAWAAIPDSGGVIHGCYDRYGHLRVIDSEAGEACTRNERELTWNQTGPQGPPGEPGADAPEWPKWYTVQVLEDGTAFRSSLDGVTATKVAVGVYHVTFPREIRSCEYFTTPTHTPVFAVPIAAYRYAGPPEQVRVNVYNADGVAADAQFQLGLICYASF